MAGKVSGPGSGPPVGGPIDDKGDRPFERRRAAFCRQARGGGRGQAAGGCGGGDAARGLTADVAAELAAGRIDAKAALDRVLERVVDKQLGPGRARRRPREGARRARGCRRRRPAPQREDQVAGIGRPPARVARALRGERVAHLRRQEHRVGVEAGQRLDQHRGAFGGRRLAVDDHAPGALDLAQPATARGIAGHGVVANLDAELRGGLLQSLRHLLGLHWLGSSSSVSGSVYAYRFRGRRPSFPGPSGRGR